MKKFNRHIITLAAVIGLAGCDKGFVEKNQNPYAFTSIEPGLLLSNVERNLSVGSWEGEQTIVQQFVNAFNLGATTGFNFNANNDGFNNTRWNQTFNNPIRYTEQIIAAIKNDASKNNMYQITRILQAYSFMVLVDTYGDVPYSEAGKAYLQGTLGTLQPKYDKSADIYADLYKELKEARAALKPTGEPVPNDIFFGTGLTSTVAAVQIPKWQKVAGSLMLRLGMRYSKVDVAKAQSIVADAMSAPGVMASNADNLVMPFNATDVNPLNNGPRATNPYYYYLTEPFVNQLKNTQDPRSKYVAAMYTNPNSIGGAPLDTDPNNQFGYPVGYDQTTVTTKVGYRGANGNGFKYTQLNYNVFGNVAAPMFFVTYAQTQLLLAEAAFKGWVPGGSGAAITYYNSGIRSSMDEYALYPNTVAIPALDYSTYIVQPSVALSGAGDASDLAKIGTQYWVVSLGNGHESWANFRRTGFPALTPNSYNTNLASSGGFARRMAYPSSERSVNTASYNAAVASMGGDDLTQRVFWDKP